MRFTRMAVLSLLLSPIAYSQTSDSNRSGISPSVNTVPPAPQVQTPAAQTPHPPSYANYSIMLVNPATGGGAVVLMHNPKNELEFVEVNSTKQALSAGYVAVRAVELGEFISLLKEENARLTADNTHLQSEQAKQVAAAPTLFTPSQADLEAQQRAQTAADKAARRQQMIQTWLMFRALTPPVQIPMPVYQPVPNPNANRLQTNCTTQRSGDTSYTDCH